MGSRTTGSHVEENASCHLVILSLAPLEERSLFIIRDSCYFFPSERNKCSVFSSLLLLHNKFELEASASASEQQQQQQLHRRVFEWEKAVNAICIRWWNVAPWLLLRDAAGRYKHPLKENNSEIVKIKSNIEFRIWSIFNNYK